MPDQPGTGRAFMEKTKYCYLMTPDQEKHILQPPLELPASPGKPLMDLPRPETIRVLKIDLRTAIEQRQSARNYAKSPLSIDDLVFLLWCTQGVKKVAGSYATFRTVPSAGARHAFETYLLINDVEGLERGMYRYLALSHQLQKLDTDPTLHIRIADACLGQQFVMRSGVVFLWVAVPYRMTWRYSERGYRELHKDAGHVCQNLYLAAQAVGCGVCAIAAFDDDVMNSILGIDGTDQFLIYLATVGKTAASGK
jgi:SagB-type dehydrogenase family enzyme